MTASWWQKLARFLSGFTPGQKVALLALLLWLVSLTLTGFVVTNESEGPWPGWRILVWGWLGLMASNVAWYANLFALWAFTRLLSDRGRQRFPACWPVLWRSTRSASAISRSMKPVTPCQCMAWVGERCCGCAHWPCWWWLPGCASRKRRSGRL